MTKGETIGRGRDSEFTNKTQAMVITSIGSRLTLAYNFQKRTFFTKLYKVIFVSIIVLLQLLVVSSTRFEVQVLIALAMI